MAARVELRRKQVIDMQSPMFGIERNSIDGHQLMARRRIVNYWSKMIEGAPALRLAADFGAGLFTETDLDSVATVVIEVATPRCTIRGTSFVTSAGRHVA